MFRRSLTLKVLVAVGVTVAIVIAIYTYFVIRVQSAWWHERIQAQNVIAATLVHEYLNGVMLSDRHVEVQGFLEKMKTSGEIWRGRLIKPDGTVIFSTDTQEVRRVVMTVPAELLSGNRVLQGIRTENGHDLSIVMRPVIPAASCLRCHQQSGTTLGAIVTEKSMEPAHLNIASNRNLLIVYGSVIFVLVSVVLWLLIVRLVSQPVGELLEQMHHVRAGNLTVRTATNRVDEIGELEQGFDGMVASLSEAKRELSASHEKQIQQASKLATIGELASGIAHEVRNPLAGIGAAVEVLAENSSPTNKEIVAEIRQQINRLNTTVCDLLDFARTREPEIAPCALPDLLRPMLALVRPDAQKHQIRIIEQIPGDLPLISADSKQIQQALLNIFLNAIQAMPNSGSLTVAAVVPAEGRVRLSVTDTGVGIPAENIQKIFSPFFTTKHRGTGLGLAITRSIIEKHNGTIAVTSEVGRGTTFTLEFATCQLEEPHA